MNYILNKTRHDSFVEKKKESTISLLAPIIEDETFFDKMILYKRSNFYNFLM